MNSIALTKNRFFTVTFLKTSAFCCAMQREFSEDVPEIMDLPSLDQSELREDLENLELLNRHFGGTKMVLDLLGRVAKDIDSFTLVDFCTGYGDHPRNMAKWAREHGKRATIIAVDFQRQTLDLAKAATPAQDNIFFVQADVRHSPFKNQSVDMVFCSLALHHFSDNDATEILREGRRMARRNVACIDLMRGRIAYAAVWLLTQFILRSPMTRHDARLSVRRSFTGNELKNLALLADWRSFWHDNLPWFRQVIVCEQTV